jgi:uncharacterized protein YeaO (DUF488 family)
LAVPSESPKNAFDHPKWRRPAFLARAWEVTSSPTGVIQMTFQIKRIYDPAEPTDGTRILVDRLWPRGIRKIDAQLDHWMKDVAPSPELRLWFDHKPDRFAEFRHRYKVELASNPVVDEVRALGQHAVVTLLYAARDPEVNHAFVLRSVLCGSA